MDERNRDLLEYTCCVGFTALCAGGLLLAICASIFRKPARPAKRVVNSVRVVLDKNGPSWAADRQPERHAKCYEGALKRLESEQGDYYVEMVLEKELGRLYRYYRQVDRDGTISDDDFDHLDDDPEKASGDETEYSECSDSNSDSNSGSEDESEDAEDEDAEDEDAEDAEDEDEDEGAEGAETVAEDDAETIAVAEVDAESAPKNVSVPRKRRLNAARKRGSCLNAAGRTKNTRIAD